MKYADGYIDVDTFQWESVANVSERELTALKNSSKIHIFVRKVDNEDGIQLPFTYIGSGKMEYIEGSKKANGAHLFRVPMDVTAPEDIFFDFNNHANTLTVGLIADVRNALNFLFFNQFGNTLNHSGLIDLLGDFVDNDCLSVLADLLNSAFSTHNNRTTSGIICRLGTTLPQN